ncbi:hypothetical protein PybrP1_008425 [[Pythium] brassicae (nom. inval.)]|nr:hypothetical protein PybrP1_008425 [[Pythium] brassicae (nom. inval.)]
MPSSKFVIGALALLAAAISTGVNETRLIRAQRSLEYGRRVAVVLAGPKLATQNDGSLVLISGLVTSNAVVLDSAGHVLAQTRAPMVMDPEFGVAVRGVRLLRRVEMLQWVETSHTSTSGGGGGVDGDAAADEERERVFMYSLRWMPERVDSSRFDNPSYRNPAQDGEPWLFESATVTAPDVVVGDFKLSDELIDQIRRRVDVSLDTASRDTMRNILDQRVGESWRERSALANVTIEEDKYFYWRQSQHSHFHHTRRTDELGDLRVSFTVVPPYAVTICAQQKQETLVPFATPRDEGGEPIFLLDDGVHSVDELFDLRSESKFRENRFSRLFSGIVGFIGFLVLHPLLAASRVGKLVFRESTGAAMPVPVVAASLSSSFTFSVAAVCWLRVRWGH